MTPSPAARLFPKVSSHLARIRTRLWTRISLILTAMALAACVQGTPGGNQPSGGSSGKVAVALLVPKSGAGGDAALATHLENAARLAIADLSGVQIDLRVYDTGGSTAASVAAANRAMDEGAQVLLGPVFAEASNAVGIAAAPRGVSVLSFSNNPSIAGGNVFVLGNLFDNTARRLVDYSARQGKRSILVVHGNGGAEIIGRDAIASAIRASGATLAGTVPFEMSQQGVVGAIPSIVARQRESGADAVFFTSGNDGAMPMLAQLMPEQGLSSSTAQWMGLQRLDIPASARALPGLQGSWFALPDPGTVAAFEQRYQAAYSMAPHSIAGLAYDGIAAIGALARKGDGFTPAALSQSQGFAGVNGVFRFLPGGTNQRALAIATIRNSQVVVLDPAPRSFGGAGF